MSSTTAVNCWCRPFTVEGRRKQSISSMLFSFGTNVCASVLFIASDTYVIRHTAKALCTRNWQNPNTAKTGEARDSRVFFEGYDLNAMSVADSQARSFSWTIVPLPRLVCLERTQHRVVHGSAVLQRRLLCGSMSADTRSTCAPHTGKFFSAHKVSLWKGTQKARLCAALRSGWTERVCDRYFTRENRAPSTFALPERSVLPRRNLIAPTVSPWLF